ncbi:MAG: hypothetical protein ACI906_000111 [Candidatus Latescibacterota bacterium]|jgi:hypothetical protein
MGALLWQIALADGLLLCLAVGLGLWFRAWLRREKEEMDRRLNALEAQQAHLDRICGRLQAACRSLELLGQSVGRNRSDKSAEPDPELDERGEDAYSQAWHMLANDTAPAEVARKLGMGIAEVELMARMLRYRRQV